MGAAFRRCSPPSPGLAPPPSSMFAAFFLLPLATPGPAHVAVVGKSVKPEDRRPSALLDGGTAGRAPVSGGLVARPAERGRGRAVDGRLAVHWPTASAAQTNFCTCEALESLFRVMYPYPRDIHFAYQCHRPGDGVGTVAHSIPWPGS